MKIAIAQLNYTIGDVDGNASKIIDSINKAKAQRADLVILAEQAELTEPVRTLITATLGIDTSSLEIVNRPPTRSKPIYMKVWEARKADGLDYDPEDPKQQAFLSEITKYNIKSIE